MPINLFNIEDQWGFLIIEFQFKRELIVYTHLIFLNFFLNFMALSTLSTGLKLLKLILLVSFKFLIHCQLSRESVPWSFMNILYSSIIARYIHYIWLFSLVIFSVDVEVSPCPMLHSCHSFSICYWNINSLSDHNFIKVSLFLPLISSAYWRPISIRLLYLTTKI